MRIARGLVAFDVGRRDSGAFCDCSLSFGNRSICRDRKSDGVWGVETRVSESRSMSTP